MRLLDIFNFPLIFIFLFIEFTAEAQGVIEPLEFNKTEGDLFGISKNKENADYNGIDTVFYVANNEFPPYDYPRVQTKDTIMAVIFYENGIKRKVTGYYSNGQKYREAFFNEKREYHGLDTKWYRNGQKFFQSYSENGKEIMPFLTWYSDGNLKSYSDYEKRITKEWYPNGQLKQEMIGIDTTAEGGIHRDFHENGQLAIEYIYNCGKQPFINYHDNGKKRLEGFIETAMWSQLGKWTEYYYSGKKKIEMYYDENIPNYRVGKWSYWDEKGNLAKEEFYENNELVSTKEYLKIKKE